MPTTYPLDPDSRAAASVRAALRARQRDLGAQIAALAVSEGRDGEVLDRKDEAALRERGEIGAAEIERDLHELHEIEAALRRLDEGRYGLCLGCDETIDARRLAAEPFAVRCAACQARAERLRARRR